MYADAMVHNAHRCSPAHVPSHPCTLPRTLTCCSQHTTRRMLRSWIGLSSSRVRQVVAAIRLGACSAYAWMTAATFQPAPSALEVQEARFMGRGVQVRAVFASAECFFTPHKRRYRCCCDVASHTLLLPVRHNIRCPHSAFAAAAVAAAAADMSDDVCCSNDSSSDELGFDEDDTRGSVDLGPFGQPQLQPLMAAGSGQLPPSRPTGGAGSGDPGSCQGRSGNINTPLQSAKSRATSAWRLPRHGAPSPPPVPAISDVRQLLAHATRLMDSANAEPHWLRGSARQFDGDAWARVLSASQVLAMRCGVVLCCAVRCCAVLCCAALQGSWIDCAAGTAATAAAPLTGLCCLFWLGCLRSTCSSEII
jgi:hypothetical protein